MDFAIVRQFFKDPKRSRKILYIAPTKALCDERHRDWSSKLQRIYRTCKTQNEQSIDSVGVEVTGDSDGQRLTFMKEADLM